MVPVGHILGSVFVLVAIAMAIYGFAWLAVLALLFTGIAFIAKTLFGV
jgi:hypothetical protein